MSLHRLSVAFLTPQLAMWLAYAFVVQPWILDIVERRVVEAFSHPLRLDGVWYYSVRRPNPPGECVAVYRSRALRDGRVTGRMTL